LLTCRGVLAFSEIPFLGRPLLRKPGPGQGDDTHVPGRWRKPTAEGSVLARSPTPFCTTYSAMMIIPDSSIAVSDSSRAPRNLARGLAAGPGICAGASMRMVLATTPEAASSLICPPSMQDRRVRIRPRILGCGLLTHRPNHSGLWGQSLSNRHCRPPEPSSCSRFLGRE